MAKMTKQEAAKTLWDIQQRFEYNLEDKDEDSVEARESNKKAIQALQITINELTK